MTPLSVAPVRSFTKRVTKWQTSTLPNAKSSQRLHCPRRQAQLMAPLTVEPTQKLTIPINSLLIPINSLLIPINSLNVWLKVLIIG
jgi:hypothetical protein